MRSAKESAAEFLFHTLRLIMRTHKKSDAVNRKINFSKKLLPFLVANIAFANAVYAQGNPEQIEEKTVQASTKKLAAVLVTAQKRAENIQEVPTTITAVSGKDIDEKQVVLSTDVERLAPNLSAQGGGRTGKPRWFLRGIGTNDPNQNQDGPLAIYVDEVVVGLQQLQSFPLFDLERVEVLRGPQGTLWGKNNTGGAIHYITRKASFNNEGYSKLTYGSYNTRIIESAFGGSIIDETLAGRISIYNESYDGWAKNIVTGDEGPNLKDQNIRVQFLGNFSPNLDAQLILATREVNAGISPSYVVGATTLPGTDITQVNPQGAINQGGTNYIPPYGSKPTIYSDYWDGEGYDNKTDNSATLKVNWQLGENTLSSVTGYSTRDSDGLTLVGVPLNTTLNRASSTAKLDSQQVSQELRLTSPKDQQLSWILGAYHYNLDAKNESRSARFAVGITREQYAESSWDQEAISNAVFGNVKYKFSDKTSITVGARYTKEKKDITETALTVTDTPTSDRVTFVSENGWYLPGGVSLLPAFSNVTLVSKDNTWDEFTWDITPEYHFNEDVLGYVRVATGFRSGGFNQAITNGDIVETKPETLTDYEAGIKSAWFDGQLTINTAVFYYDIKSLQLNIQRAFLNTSTNTYTSSAAGESDGTVKGIELEFNALASVNWRVGGSLGYLKSEYTDFIYYIGGGGPFDASGNAFYRTPEVSLRLDTDYTIPLANGNIILATDWSYRSRVYHNATVQNDPLQETTGYWIGNLRVSYETADRNWIFTGFVNNVTDKSPVFLRQIANPNTGTQPNSISAPKTWGVQVNYKF
jgi:iron complex outermembrane receptor protein